LSFYSFCFSPERGRPTSYYRHIFFDNSIAPDVYFYSSGKASRPSTLQLTDGKLPVDTKFSYTPPNALHLEWTSVDGGGWNARVDVMRFRNREINFLGTHLSFWCFSPQGMAAAAMPVLRILDLNAEFSASVKLQSFAGDLQPGRWVRVKIPLERFSSASIRRKLGSGPRPASGAPHHLPLARWRHLPAHWHAGPRDIPLHRFPRQNRARARYQVTASDRNYRQSAFSELARASTRPMTDEELLTMLEEGCFRYYWEGAHPEASTTLENIPGDDRIVATGASGFGIMALIVGVDRGFITREQGLERLAKIVDFFERAPRYHGVWSHFMDGQTRQGLPVFDMFDDAGDLVETAFLMEGLLAARQYFRGANDAERSLYQKITQLWETVEWDRYRRSPESEALYWHWSPDWGWHINHRVTGFNEAVMAYLLGVASPTHAVPAELYYTGWAGQSKAAMEDRRGSSASAAGDRYVNGHTYFGIKLDVGIGSGGPLFFRSLLVHGT
jgi:hypothetical protein